MHRPNSRDALEQQVVNLLAANPKGLASPRLRARLRPRISQPTLSRLLADLRTRGRVTKTGAARASRYHLVGGSITAADVKSRLMHERVAARLMRDPSLKSQAIQRLDVIRKANPSARTCHDRWAELLDGDMPALLRNMTEDSEQAAALRRGSPFTVLYYPKLRRRLFRPSSG